MLTKALLIGMFASSIAQEPIIFKLLTPRVSINWWEEEQLSPPTLNISELKDSSLRTVFGVSTTDVAAQDAFLENMQKCHAHNVDPSIKMWLQENNCVDSGCPYLDLGEFSIKKNEMLGACVEMASNIIGHAEQMKPNTYPYMTFLTFEGDGSISALKGRSTQNDAEQVRNNYYKFLKQDLDRYKRIS